ncbi:hypothetical protein C1H46_013627 [Malus baccata]|uniref:Uncharacterized protein n=1 Tax=Malus baccata TaxID=106549 RepID=A0A540MPY6_MALBA|nr:hypothetical protein C1H46_013627 [Malus baccata]
MVRALCFPSLSPSLPLSLSYYLQSFCPATSQDYLKSVVPSQLLSERGSNLVVINLGSANIRIGLLLNTQVATTQYKDRQKAYDMIASFLKIPFIDKEVANNSYPRKEGLAAAFGNGLSTACVIKMGAQVTSVICIESWSSTYDNVSVVSSIVHDGAALPNTEKTLPFGGEDISRCLLWTQRHHQTWPQIRTDMFTKLIDLLMRNRLKESYCEIKEGELDAVGVVHSYEDGMPAGSHKTRLTALNVRWWSGFDKRSCSCSGGKEGELDAVGVVHSNEDGMPAGSHKTRLTALNVHAYPPPPGVWFRDYEDMLEDTWHMEFPRRPEMSDSLFPNMNTGYPMWDGYPAFSAKPKKEEKVGLAEAITSSILSTDLQRKLLCSILLVGGVASTRGLVPAVEERLRNLRRVCIRNLTTCDHERRTPITAPPVYRTSAKVHDLTW